MSTIMTTGAVDLRDKLRWGSGQREQSTDITTEECELLLITLDRVAKLEGDLSICREHDSLTVDSREAAGDVIRSLKAQLADAVVALRKYGEHGWACAVPYALTQTTGNTARPDCTCGFTEALAKLPQPEETEETDDLGRCVCINQFGETCGFGRAIHADFDHEFVNAPGEA